MNRGAGKGRRGRELRRRGAGGVAEDGEGEALGSVRELVRGKEWEEEEAEARIYICFNGSRSVRNLKLADSEEATPNHREVNKSSTEQVEARHSRIRLSRSGPSNPRSNGSFFWVTWTVVPSGNHRGLV